jgi:hypothetical protein
MMNLDSRAYPDCSGRRRCARSTSHWEESVTPARCSRAETPGCIIPERARAKGRDRKSMRRRARQRVFVTVSATLTRLEDASIDGDQEDMPHQPPASHDGVTSPVTNDARVGPAARRVAALSSSPRGCARHAKGRAGSGRSGCREGGVQDEQLVRAPSTARINGARGAPRREAASGEVLPRRK